MAKSPGNQTSPGTRKNSAQPGTRSADFQARVDYVAKALRRGSGGPTFKAYLEQHDSVHIAAILMKRANRSEDLRNAIITAFGVKTWNDVPWHETAKSFMEMSAQQIGMLAETTRKQTQAQFTALSRNTDLILY